MQDYKHFIAEVNRIEVKTKQFFVKDGFVLHDEPVKTYLELDPKGERWPGYLSTFYDFDQYNADDEHKLYEAHLAKLREVALIDLMVLNSDQLNRFIADLKAKRDRMNRLFKLAKDLDKEYLHQEFDKALSLEHNLFEAFGIAQPLSVSLETLSARYLMQAVAAKRNQLVSIVNQIELALNLDTVDDPTSTKESEENVPIPNLFIRHDSRQTLYDKLKALVNTDSEGTHRALYNLIFLDQVPDTPILITGSVNKFGWTFHSSEAVPPQGSKVLSEQLPKYFRSTDGQELEPLKPSYLVKLLRGRREKSK